MGDITNPSSWDLENSTTNTELELLNKRWRQRIIDTEYINERAITTMILVNRQHIKLMSVYVTHSKYADHHIEKMYKRSRKEWRIVTIT